MFIYTTCRDCGGLLHTTDGDTVHPGCTPKPTKAEQYGQQWLEAALRGGDTECDRLHALIDVIDTAPPRMLAAALRYADWGWPVFPLKTGSKTPATPHGFKDATTDPDRITTWWTRHPGNNIGIPTGHAFDVIDIDVPQGPLSYSALLERENPHTGIGPIPDVHGQVATSSGGLHLYIPATGAGNRAALLPGIDIRGVGGYVVAPPSTLGPPGRAWSWISHPSPVLTAGVTCGR